MPVDVTGNFRHFSQRTPLPHYHSHALVKSKMVYPSRTGLSRLSWRKAVKCVVVAAAAAAAAAVVLVDVLLQTCVCCTM